MKRALFTSTIFMLLALVSAAFYFFGEKDSGRNQYEEFILQQALLAEQTNQKTSEDLKSADQPDMAAFQEYLSTVDPHLGYVPKKRLWNAYQYTKQLDADIKSMRSLTAPMEWLSTGANMGGRTRTLMFDPNDAGNNKVWAGAVTGGLWYTDDITNTSEQWMPVGDFWSNLAISCMTYDPNDPEIFYAGTGEAQTARVIYRESSGVGAGLFKSSDAGETWEQLESTKEFDYITDVIVRDESGTSAIYIGVASGTYMGIDHESEPTDGLYRSVDGGISWEQVLPLMPGFNTGPYVPADIELASNGRIFIGTMENLLQLGGATILYSDEGTKGSWSVFKEYNLKIENDPNYNIPARTIVASAPGKPDVVYAQFAAGFINGANGFTYYKGRYMVKSTDGGETWIEINIPDQDWSTLAWHAFDLKVDPSNENAVFTGGLDLWKTTNGGSTWRHISDWSLMYYGGGDEYVHADQHNIQFKPGSPNTAIFSSDGGVFLTETASQNYPVFIERSQGYNTLQFYSCAINPNAGSKKYIGGLQDNGTLYYNGSPLDIQDMIDGGDGAFCFWDENESNTYITSVYYNAYTAWLNGLETEYFGGNSGTFVSPADYDFDNNILYSNAVSFTGADKNKLLRVSGIPLNINEQFITLGTNSDVAFSHVKYSPYSPSGTSTLFVGTEAGKLFRIENAQGNPITSEIGSEDFPTARISCVAIGDSEDFLLVTFSNYGVSSIWLTMDGGKSWIEKESNLPDMPVRWALIHPENNGQALLATETGVWATNTLLEEETEWAPSNDGMANVRVDMLKLRKSDNVVLAASHGRGLFTATYELDIYTGQEENFVAASSLKVFPNPAADWVSLEATLEKPQQIKLVIYNLLGQMVMQEEFSSTSGKFTQRLNIEKLQKGTYLVSLNYDSKNEVSRLVVN